MSFTFVDAKLDALAKKQMTFENWQAFVGELSQRDLPACYKPAIFDNLEQYRLALPVLMLGGSLVRDGVDALFTKARAFMDKALKKGEFTIYEIIESYPDLLFS